MAGMTVLLIAVAYLALTVGIGLLAWYTGVDETMEGYLLSNREINSTVGLFSLAATMFSAASMLGFAAWHLESGIGSYLGLVGRFAIAAGIFYYFVAPRIWKLGRKYGHITPSDLVADYFESERLGVLVGVLFVFGILVPVIIAQMIGVRMLVDIATGNLVPTTPAIGVIAVAIALYAFLGGMKSIAWVDFMQGVLMLGVTIGGGVLMVFTVGGGLGPSLQSAATQIPNIIDFQIIGGAWDYPYILSFAFGSLFGVALYPHSIMRLHYFDSVSRVRALSWKVPLIKTLIQLGALLIVLVGATAVFPENAERIVLETFKEFYPPAIFALAVSGGLAAMMSTASSLTHGIGAVMSRDITQPLFPEWNEKRHFWIARVTAGGGILAAFVFSQFATGIIAELAIAATALALIIVAPILVTAVYTVSFVNRKGALLSVAAGFLVGLLVIAYPPFRHPFGIHGGTFGLATSITVLLAGSYLTSGSVSSEKIREWREVLATDGAELDEGYRKEILGL